MQALKIRRVFAENYKAFAESVAVDVEPLTLIFGGNGSGKSALLRLPAAISAGLAGGASPGLPLQIYDNVPLGQSLSSFVHGGAVGGQFSVGVEFSGSAATERWRLDVSVGKDPRSRNQLPAQWIDRWTLRRGEALKGDFRSGGPRGYRVDGGESTDPPVRFAGLLPLLADGGPHPLVAALRPTPRVAHLAAARGAPGSEFTPYSPGAALEVGYFGAETRQVLGALRYLSTTRALDAVKAAVEACFGVELRVVEVGEGAVIGTMIECRPRGRSTWLPLREMGTGLSHALPLIVQCACLMHPAEGMPWPTLLTCEEPEAHCHPVVQAALADVAIDAALAGDTSVMVETHSETFVLRVRRRVAEGRLPPSKVAIYWVDNEGAATRVSRLSLDERGRISDWPEGWFDAALHEVSAIHRAMVREG